MVIVYRILLHVLLQGSKWDPGCTSTRHNIFTIIQPKKQKTLDQKYCLEPNIRSNLHLVTIYLVLWSKIFGLGFYLFLFIWSSGFGLISLPHFIFGNAKKSLVDAKNPIEHSMPGALKYRR